MYEEVVIDRNMRVSVKPGEYLIEIIFQSVIQAARGKQKVKFTFTFLALRIYRYPDFSDLTSKTSLL